MPQYKTQNSFLTLNIWDVSNESVIFCQNKANSYVRMYYNL